MNGYNGKIAKIDLSLQTTEDVFIGEKDLKMYLGGKSMAAKIIYDAADEKIEAFSEKNMIVITTSALTGSTAPCSSRFNISTISPLTGLLTSSNCGGNFGLNLKKAGYDGVVITGKSEQKVYIDITDNKIEIKSAEHLWGLLTGEAQEKMGEEKRGKLVIGPAGENKVRYAAVICEERAAGRGGVGAIFGDKNLKGLIASGKVSMEMADKENFKTFNKKWIELLQKHMLTGEQLPKLGTAGLLSLMNYRNLLATRNYSKGSYEDFEKINGETLSEEHLVKNKGCLTCPIRCGRVVMAYGKEVKGPEVETLGLLGSNLCNNNLQSIINLNHLCDEYGIDTISFGSTVGFAMELNEKGIWSNGLNFGEHEQLEELVRLVAMREGLGSELAEGTERLSEKYGGKEFAIHVKGMELAAYEPRAAQGMGLGYATSNRGGCHLNGGYLVILEGLGLNVSGSTTRGKAAFTIFFQDIMEAVSAGGTCLFTTYAMLPQVLIKNPNRLLTRIIYKTLPSFGIFTGFFHNNTWLLGFNLNSVLPHPKAIQLVTGFSMNIGRFVKAGERGYNTERLINLRQGLKGSDDTLPKRLTHELQREDEPESKVKLNEMLGEYYSIRGWSNEGVPSLSRLKRLGIEVKRN
ncbi:MAG TPA: aldehyde ferredoxin oxidoreductase family protein [Anaerovoracaceae bacterium]|nr:aldehyde ferredoxin oxidoreductase family protein [Anaerovoracaceae bacterium]